MARLIMQEWVTDIQGQFLRVTVPFFFKYWCAEDASGSAGSLRRECHMRELLTQFLKLNI
jgi:protein gp37